MSDFWKNIIKLILPYLLDFLNGLIEDKLGAGTQKAMTLQIRLDKLIGDIAADTDNPKLRKIWRRNNNEIKIKIEKYRSV